MIDQGIVQLINSNSAVAGLLGTDPSTGAPLGGFGFGQMPQDLSLPSWEFRFFGGQSMVGLTTIGGYRWRRLEISIIGTQGDPTIVSLASAINSLLEGYFGTLSDPDSTVVDSILELNSPIDFFDAPSRAWRRVLEYEVRYWGAQ